MSERRQGGPIRIRTVHPQDEVGVEENDLANVAARAGPIRAQVAGEDSGRDRIAQGRRSRHDDSPIAVDVRDVSPILRDHVLHVGRVVVQHLLRRGLAYRLGGAFGAVLVDRQVIVEVDERLWDASRRAGEFRRDLESTRRIGHEAEPKGRTVGCDSIRPRSALTHLPFEHVHVETSSALL